MSAEIIMINALINHNIAYLLTLWNIENTLNIVIFMIQMISDDSLNSAVIS